MTNGSDEPGGTAALLTWRELLAEVVAALEAAGFGGAALDARRLVAQASGHDDTALVMHLGEHATERSVAHLDSMVQRRLAGEPLQYVLGSWGFRSLDLFLDRRVLIPRPETEQLVEVALAEYDRIAEARSERDRSEPMTVVDLGTGSGAIALSMAVERRTADVWATDRSADALAVARANLVGIGREAARVRVVEGSWFDALPGELIGAVDVIVSNPPYVTDDDPLPVDVESWEPAVALRAGPDGRRDLTLIVEGAPEWLRRGGSLVVELDPRQAEAVAEHMTVSGLVASVHHDLAGRERIVVGRSPAER